MRRSALVLGVAVALGVASAQAADLPVKTAPVLPPAPVTTWTGWYIGANAGWIGGASDLSNVGTDTGGGGLGTALRTGAIPSSVDGELSGFIGGAQIGYNWQVSNWLWGIEADFNGTTPKMSRTIGPIVIPGFVPQTSAFTREIDWLATVRGRLGWVATPNLLVYGTGGLAVGEVKIGNAFICLTCGPSTATEPSTANTNSTTATGWTLGGGVEWMFAPRWSVKAEYLYVDLGSHSSTITYTYGASVSTMTSSVNDRFNIVRAGLNFHF